MYGNLIRSTNRRGHRDTLATYRRKWQAYGDQSPPLEVIVDPEYLICVFEDLKRRAGQAPGPDRISYNDLGKREVAQICRTLSRAVLRDRYVVGPCREVRIPKAAGRGYRTLRLRNIDYRILSAALNTALTPMWEKLFLPQSMGFRPNRSPWTLLINMEKDMIRHGAWVIAQDDVQKAFDYVNVDQLLDLHQKHIPDPQLLHFIETLLRGHNERRIGIDQGSAYSPTCLNLVLHYAHDLGMNSLNSMNHDPCPLWYRYADNLIYVSQSVPEGQQVLAKAQKFVQEAGLFLKGEEGKPKDMKEGEKTQLLGYTLSLKNHRLHYELGDNALSSLKQSLLQALEHSHPHQTLNAVIRGWIESQGPTFENRRQSQKVCSQLYQLCLHLSHREIPAPRELLSRMKQANDRFQQKREEALKDLDRASDHYLLVTAPPATVFAGTPDRCADAQPRPKAPLDTPQGETTLRGIPAGGSMAATALSRGQLPRSGLPTRRSALTRRRPLQADFGAPFPSSINRDPAKRIGLLRPFGSLNLQNYPWLFTPPSIHNASTGLRSRSPPGKKKEANSVMPGHR